MKIETKFNIGDNIFHLVPNVGKIVETKIIACKIEISALAGKKVTKDNNCEVTYICSNDGSNADEIRVGLKVSESKAFKTKDELLKSL